MLLYEYKVRDEFERVKQYATNLRAKFDSEACSEELLQDRDNLAALCDNLNNLLPKEIVGKTNLERHLAWMKKRLGEKAAYACKSDINDICKYDLPGLEKLWRDWCASIVHYDTELAEKTSNLLIHREYDSAIRKAFVILKSRLVSKFELPESLDGSDMVNKVFGAAGILAGRLEGDERQAMRNLLSGLYGVFRNDYMHQDIEPAWPEVDAVLSMINFALMRIDTYRETKQ